MTLRTGVGGRGVGVVGPSATPLPSGKSDMGAERTGTTGVGITETGAGVGATTGCGTGLGATTGAGTGAGGVYPTMPEAFRRSCICSGVGANPPSPPSAPRPIPPKPPKLPIIT